MADEEKALGQSNGLVGDRLSLKSPEDSNKIEAVFECDGLHHSGCNEVITARSDVEKALNHPTPHNCASGSPTDPKLVDWNEYDPENPMNFGLGRKLWTSAMAFLMTFCVSFASSVFSADTRVTAKEFNVGEEVMVSIPCTCVMLRDKEIQYEHISRPRLTSAP